MLEKVIEKYLVDQCKRYGILCEKFTSVQRRSVPDRILTYVGRVVFLELKAPGAKPTENQAEDHKRRAYHGVDVCWTDSKAGVDTVVQRMLTYRTISVCSGYKVVPDGD